MGWLAWVVLAALVAMTVVWLVRRFRTENRRIDGMLRDFDRETHARSPHCRRSTDGSPFSAGADRPKTAVLVAAQVTGILSSNCRRRTFARQHPHEES